jgi:hypothetical protein
MRFPWPWRKPLSAEAGFLDRVDRLAAKLTAQGFPIDGQRLHDFVHKTVFTTSSELIGELRLVLKDMLKRNRRQLPRELVKELRRLIWGL